MTPTKSDSRSGGKGSMEPVVNLMSERLWLGSAPRRLRLAAPRVVRGELRFACWTIDLRIDSRGRLRLTQIHEDGLGFRSFERPRAEK